jgi:hypothetical protein
LTVSGKPTQLHLFPSLPPPLLLCSASTSYPPPRSSSTLLPDSTNLLIVYPLSHLLVPNIYTSALLITLLLQQVVTYSDGYCSCWGI